MKNFIKELLVVISVIILVQIYSNYILFYDYWVKFENKKPPYFSTDVGFSFSTWHIALCFSIIFLLIIFFLWQIFTQFKKTLRNSILLFLSIIVLGFAIYIDNQNVIETVEYSKGAEGWVIYPPLSALGNPLIPKIKDTLIEELTWQLRGIEIVLACLCIFLVNKIYQHNQIFAK
jgi:magnesium-transporting ATPase (P-type)